MTTEGGVRIVAGRDRAGRRFGLAVRRRKAVRAVARRRAPRRRARRRLRRAGAVGHRGHRRRSAAWIGRARALRGASGRATSAIVRAADYAAGMSASLRAGVASLPAGHRRRLRLPGRHAAGPHGGAGAARRGAGRAARRPPRRRSRAGAATLCCFRATSSTACSPLKATRARVRCCPVLARPVGSSDRRPGRPVRCRPAGGSASPTRLIGGHAQVEARHSERGRLARNLSAYLSRVLC